MWYCDTMICDVHNLTFWKKPKQISPIFRILPHPRRPWDAQTAPAFPSKRSLILALRLWKTRKAMPKFTSKAPGTSFERCNFRTFEKGYSTFCGRDFDVSAPYSGGKWPFVQHFPVFSDSQKHWRALLQHTLWDSVWTQPLQDSFRTESYISLCVSLSRAVLFSPHCQIKSK